METKQEVKIGYPYDCFIFRINGRLQSLQWHSKSETICLGMPEHSIYLFLVSYLRKWLLLKHWATSWGIHLIHCTMKPYSKISWIVHKTHTHKCMNIWLPTFTHQWRLFTLVSWEVINMYEMTQLWPKPILQHQNMSPSPKIWEFIKTGVFFEPVPQRSRTDTSIIDYKGSTLCLVSVYYTNYNLNKSFIVHAAKYKCKVSSFAHRQVVLLSTEDILKDVYSAGCITLIKSYTKDFYIVPENYILKKIVVPIYKILSSNIKNIFLSSK